MDLQHTSQRVHPKNLGRIGCGGFQGTGANNRKAKKENTKPNSQKALGSLTSKVVDGRAHSVIYVSPPKSSIVITVARVAH